MITPGEVRRSITAVWNIFLGRSAALGDLDTSNDGFWRSFQAILLVAPLYAIASMADWRVVSVAVDPGTPGAVTQGAFLASRAVTLAFDWITLPILLALLAGFLGIGRTYGAFIVARNWSVPLAMAPFAGLAVLETLGILSSDIATILSIVVFAFTIRLAYMVVRTALGVAAPVAVGYILFDFLVSLALARIITALFGVPMF